MTVSRCGKSTWNVENAHANDSRMTRTLLQYGVTLAVGLLLLKAVVWLLESRMAFFPLRGEQTTPGQRGIPYRDLTLTTGDGETIHGWMLEHPTPRAHILYWHGNGGNLSIWLEPLVEIHRQGFTVSAIDYRGYGRSTGRPSEQGLYRDTDALLDHVGASGRRSGLPVIYWGRSLGGAAAAYATTVAAPDGLILESTFPHVQSLLRREPVMAVLGLFTSYRFPVAEFLRQYRGPTLVLHGSRDRVVPHRLGVRLFERIEAEKRMVTIPGAGHNDNHPAAESDYWAPVLEFLEGVERTGDESAP